MNNGGATRNQDARITIFDTTLRDGEQCPGASLNLHEKMEVADQLARLNVDVIEAGFPIASEGDFESVQRIAETIDGPVIAGLARAVELDINRAWEALQNCPRPRIHTFIATSDIHLEHKLRMSREQVLKAAVEAVQLAKSHCEDVEFSPEDATRTDIGYLCEVVEATIDAGATTINIPDTVGYTLPEEFRRTMRALFERVSNINQAVISVHCHNDLGLAVANSLAAVVCGARQVECTINGIGERAGNAALEEVVMALRTRHDLLHANTGIHTREIYRASRLVSDLTGFVVQPNKAIVGRNAFAHEAGIHQHGVLAEKRTYEIMDAESIGLPSSELVLGKHSGRHAFEERLRELGYELSRDDLNKAFRRFKRVADKKKFVSDRDLESLVADEVIQQVDERYHLDYMQVVAGGSTVPTATVKLTDTEHGETLVQSGIGVGAVDAVFRTIEAMVAQEFRLVDYSVKSVTGGTDALGQVTVRLQNGNNDTFIGRGASMDILEASAKAYIQAINKLIGQTTKVLV